MTLLELVLERLKSFEGDFVTGLERTGDLMLGFVEGLSTNNHISLSESIDLVLQVHDKFGFFIKKDQENKVKFSKVENEIDEGFFKSFENRQRANYEKTFRIQEGAAEGKSIRTVISQNHQQKKRKQKRRQRKVGAEDCG
jgi:hypothetical protein